MTARLISSAVYADGFNTIAAGIGSGLIARKKV